MRIRALAVLVLMVAAVSCGESEERPPPPPDVDRQDILTAVLDVEDVGDGWKPKENAGPNTVQIGGKVGAASIRPLLAEGTSAFDQEDGTGFVSDTVLLLRSETAARAVINAHEEAVSRDTWSQDRDDGGRATFSFSGAVGSLPALGDEMFAARLKAVVTSPNDQTSEHAVEYVAYSIGPLVAVVVTQDVPAGRYARRLEPRVARLLTR